MSWGHNRYNKRSAAKLGWNPSWFKAEDFDDKLTDNIKDFQDLHDLKADGLCGPITYRCILLEREFMELENNYIICEDEKIKIDWDKVVNLHSENALVLPKGCYRRHKKNKRKPHMIVTHFDVCLSAKSCYRVLKKKGISSHFAIDNDGTIYQMVDTQNEGWHAGNRKVNKAAIGIDISNAVYPKYQSWYRKKGFGKRPILTDVKVHGRTAMKCLGFYPVQLEAYKVLVKTLCGHYNIPLAMPMAEDDTVLRTVHRDTVSGKFKGIVNHYHVTRGKWDTANLDWDEMLKDLNM